MRHSKFKIFISGNQKELKAERLAAKSFIVQDVLLAKHFDVYLFEDTPAHSKSSKSTYLDEIRGSDIYIGIFGDKYGAIGSDKISATEREFRLAEKLSKEMLIFLKGSDDTSRDKKLLDLIAKVRESDSGYVYKRFNDIQELKTHIYGSIIAFLEERGVVSRQHFDASVCRGATYKDIDEDMVRGFLSSAQAKRNYAISPRSSTKEALTHLNLLSDDNLTNAAIMLFGKNPQKFHIQAEVKCLHVHGTEIEKPFETYHIYKGNVFNQVDSALDFVLGRLKRPVIPESGKAATKRPFEIPEFVIREAIVNAVAHRDYYSSAGVQVTVFADRIEVWNPGRLPPQLTVDLLKKPHPSFPNNPLICEPLYLAKYVEKAGSGTVEMIKQCKANGLPEPGFTQKMGHFVTTIWRDIFTEEYISKLGLNERQLKAIRYVKEHLKINNKDYREICHTSERSATRDLGHLVAIKVFEQIGVTGKGTEYSLRRHKAANAATDAID